MTQTWRKRLDLHIQIKKILKNLEIKCSDKKFGWRELNVHFTHETKNM